VTAAILIVAAHCLWEFRVRLVARPARWKKETENYLARVKNGEAAVCGLRENALGEIVMSAQRAGCRMEPGLFGFVQHCEALEELGERAERFKRFVLLKWSFMLVGIGLLRLTLGGTKSIGFEDEIFCLLGSLLLMGGASGYLRLLDLRGWDLDEAEASRLLAKNLKTEVHEAQAARDEIAMRISKWQELLPIFEISMGLVAAGLWLFHPGLDFMKL
jgi:hypothetical protein